MPHNQIGGNYIDLNKITEILFSKWRLFLAAITVSLVASVVYLKVTPKLYPVRSSIQVINQLVSDKSAGGERFISGQELLAGNPELEDEIGILSSYPLVEKALANLNFHVTYYKYRPGLGFLGKSLAKEIYNEGLQSILDTSHFQIINTPIYISFPDANHYRIQINSSEAVLYNLTEDKPIQKNITINIDETVPISKPFKNDFLHFYLDLDSAIDKSLSYFFEIRSRVSLVKNYSSRLKINTISKESNIVNLTINSTIPEKEIDFLNALATEYIQNDLMKENQLGLKTLEFIDFQLVHIYDSLETVERSLKSFRQANRIVDIPTTSSNYNSQLEQLEEEQAKILVQQKYLRFTLENLKKNEESLDIVAPSSVGLNDPFLNNLMLQLTELNKEKISKSYSSGPSSLVSQVLAEKINNIKAALQENVDNLLNSTKIALQQNEKRMNKIVSRIEELPESERDLTNLNRKFSFNDNVYNYLLEKRVEAGIALASNLPDKSIIDQARLVSNEPVSPNTTLILFGAIMVGFSLPIGIILVQQFLDLSIGSAKEAEALLQLPVIGVLSRIKKKDQHKSISHGPRLQSESFRFLVTDLKQDYNLTENKIIGVTSIEHGEGKTFTCVNMAMTFSRIGLRTMLIDGDIYQNDIKTYFPQTELNEGLLEFLHVDRELKSCIQASPFKNLHYLQVGRTTNGAGNAMLAYENKLASMFIYLKQHYDVIIVDTPAFSKTADYFLLSQFFTINLIVVRHKKTNRKELEKATPQLLRKKIKNLKALYNDVPERTP